MSWWRAFATFFTTFAGLVGCCVEPLCRRRFERYPGLERFPNMPTLQAINGIYHTFAFTSAESLSAFIGCHHQRRSQGDEEAECADLALTAGPPAANGFALAARYTSMMLPQIFRTDERPLRHPRQGANGAPPADHHRVTSIGLVRNVYRSLLLLLVGATQKELATSVIR